MQIVYDYTGQTGLRFPIPDRVDVLDVKIGGVSVAYLLNDGYITLAEEPERRAVIAIDYTFKDEEDLEAIPTFYAKWSHNILPDIGPPPFWATNASATATPTVVDHLGILRNCQINEARFRGAMRVENLLTYSNVFSDASWVKNGTASISQVTTDAALLGIDAPVPWLLTADGTSNSLYQIISNNGAGAASGVLRATPHTLSVWLKAGTAAQATLQLYVSGGSTAALATVTLTNQWQRFAITGTPDGTSTYRALITTVGAGTLYMRNVQLEDLAGVTVDGSGNVPPNDYVSRGSISTSTQSINVYHGAMVDGVKYFDKTHRNTVNNTTKVVTEGAGPTIAQGSLKGLDIEFQCTNLALNSETLSGWTINATTSVSAAVVAAQAPNGLLSAVRITEDSASTSKFLSLAHTGLTDNVKYCAQVFAKAESRSWLRLAIQQKTGTTITGYFNLTTGVVGNIAAGGEAYIESVGNGWYLCSVVASVSAGGTTPTMHVGITSGSLVSTYTGNGSSILVWGAQFHNKESPASYFKTVGTPTIRTGHALAFRAEGLIGLNNFGAYFEMYPRYNTGIIGKTTDGSAQGWYYPLYFRAMPPNQVYNRCGLSIRPYADTYTGNGIWAMDRYLGEPTQALKWTAGTLYEVGDLVVPSDTQANNANAKKLYTCTQRGTSHASVEPTWNVSGFPTVDQADGTARWQCNHDNRSVGSYDPNDGCHTLLNAPANVKCKVAFWYLDTPVIGCSVNGTLGIPTTAPFPIDGSTKGDLRVAMGEMRLAREGTLYAVSSQSYRNLRLWNKGVRASDFQQKTM